jgi:hypothetical protein
MPDEQEKSGDLIAELAKLMAVGGAEPEVRPAPRPVHLEPAPAVPPSNPAGNAAPAPARPMGLRIPGMDQPVSIEPPIVAQTTALSAASVGSAPSVQPTLPLVTAPQSAVQPPAASTAPAIRIPGMERPAPVPPPQREPTIDFGALPPPVVPRPQPINDWQNRETPKTTVQLAIEAEEDSASNEGSEPRARDERPKAEPETVAESSDKQAVNSPAPLRRQAETFDPTNSDSALGGRATTRPAPAAPTVAPQPNANDTAPAVKSLAQAQSVDPIADLIAAELDAGLSQPTAPAPVSVSAPVASPMGQSAPQPAATPGAPMSPRTIEPRARSNAPVTGRPAMPRPPVAAENDRFAVSPIFGPASKGSVEPAPQPNVNEPVQVMPPPPVPQGAPGQRAVAADRDPMDEIESLIGEAVRVELVQAERNAAARASGIQKPAALEPKGAEPKEATKAETRQQPPVVPPLTAGLPPRRAALKDTEPTMGAEEVAALTAAASLAAQAGKKPVRPPKPEPIEARPKPPRVGRGMRQYVGMAVAGTLLLASGLGLYWVLTMNPGTNGEVPVLQADAEPVKKDAPAQPSTNNGQGSVVFNELEGKSDTSNEVLVSRDETADTPIADVAKAEPEATSTGDTELANRKVRTVTVRPDGSIVSGDEAGSEALPVDRPNLPSIPTAGGDTQATDLLASVQNGAVAVATEPTTSATTGALQDPAAQLAAIQPSPGNVIDPNIVAPVPLPRVADRSQLRGNSSAASTSPVDPPPLDIGGGTSASAPRVVSGGSGTYVQLSSQRTQEDASAALRRTQQRLGGVIDGGALELRRVDLGAKGIWYRVVLPTSSFQEATQACASIKANGGDCVAING